MVWIIIAVVVLGISAYFGNEYRLDRKAHKLNSGSEEERRLAAEMQELARKIDEGKYLYRRSCRTIVLSCSAQCDNGSVSNVVTEIVAKCLPWSSE